MPGIMSQHISQQGSLYARSARETSIVLIKLATPLLFGHRRSTSLPPAFAFQALAWTTCIHFAQQALTTQRSQEFWRKYPPTACLKTWKSDPSFHHVHCQSSACRRVLALEAPARMFEEKTSKKKTYTNPCTNTTRTNICGDVFTDAKCGNRDGHMWPQSWHLHVRIGMANLQRKNSGIDHSRTKRAPDFRIQSARVPDANKMPRDPVSSAGPFLSQGNSLRTASRMSPFVVASRTPGDHC